MCLIVFSVQPDSNYPLILAANRDEYYQRPAREPGYWEDQPDIFGGRDLEAGGSWLAINRNGRLAAVTNYREPPGTLKKRSRGALVSEFVSSSLSAPEYLNIISTKADQWAGFNLLVADHTGLYCFSNRSPTSQSIQPLLPGAYGLCNHLLNTPWPKLVNTRDRFAKMALHTAPEGKPFIELMGDRTNPPVEQLPDTGVSLEVEMLLSSCFIASETYGTRNTSVLILDRSGRLQWTEQQYLANGVLGERSSFSLSTGFSR